jgi:hypothetical protein
MLVSSFNLSQSFNYMPYLFYKKRFKSEIDSFCIWTLNVVYICIMLGGSFATLLYIANRYSATPPAEGGSRLVDNFA